jgi:serine/threonine protein kinase
MHMHAHNFIHRDIKPMNIFVVDKNLLKLGDFSESRSLKYGVLLKCGKRVVGSPFTMAPELVKKTFYDFRVCFK